MTKHVIIALVAAAGLAACESGDKKKQTSATTQRSTTDRPVTQTVSARDMQQGWVPGQPPSATTSTSMASAEATTGQRAGGGFTVQPAARTMTLDAAPIGGDAFVRGGLAGDMFEIESSQLALERASDERVRQFAQMMIDDHTPAFEQLSQAAEVQGVTPPNAPIPRHLALLDRLSTLQGEQFDREYSQAQVDSHQEAVRLHEQFLRTGRNPQFQALAEQRLPILRDHLEEARILAEDLDRSAQVRRGGDVNNRNADPGQPRPMDRNRMQPRPVDRQLNPNQPPAPRGAQPGQPVPPGRGAAPRGTSDTTPRPAERPTGPDQPGNQPAGEPEPR